MIELKVTADQPADLGAQIAGLAALFGTLPPSVGPRASGRPAPGRARRTRAEVAEDGAAAPLSDKPAAASREDVRRALVAQAAELDQARRSGLVQSLLRPFGVTRLADLPDARLPDLMAALASPPA